MTGKELKRVAEGFFRGRSLGPEFVKQWDGCVLLTAEEAEKVLVAVGCAHPITGEDHEAVDDAFALLTPDRREKA